MIDVIFDILFLVMLGLMICLIVFVIYDKIKTYQYLKEYKKEQDRINGTDTK